MYHCLEKYVGIYHYFGPLFWNSSLLYNSSSFFEKLAFKFAMLFFMELELHQKLVAILGGTFDCHTNIQGNNMPIVEERER